jgi:hypothetical protein
VNPKAKISLYTPQRTFFIIDNVKRNRKYFGKVIAGKGDGKYPY